MKQRYLFALVAGVLFFAGCGSSTAKIQSAAEPTAEPTAEPNIDPSAVIDFNGLQWQVGPDQPTNWNEAKAWVDGLGGNWRMPTRAELQALWDAGISYDNWGPFENSRTGVWSGEVRDSSSAWRFLFLGGREVWGSRSDSASFCAFAVRPREAQDNPITVGQDDPITEHHSCPYCDEVYRSQSAIDSHIVSEHRLQLITKSGEIITDSHTGLQWRVGPDRNTNWSRANAWVDGLGGNWRMPTRAELQGLCDVGIRRGNWGLFENSGWFVWSGEVRDSSSAWGFSFSLGAATWNDRFLPSYVPRVFAVRPQ